MIHGFDDKEAALSVLSVLQMHKSYKMTDKSFIISTEDYKIVQMKKKLEEWILLNKKWYKKGQNIWHFIN